MNGDGDLRNAVRVPVPVSFVSGPVPVPVSLVSGPVSVPVSLVSGPVSVPVSLVSGPVPVPVSEVLDFEERAAILSSNAAALSARLSSRAFSAGDCVVFDDDGGGVVSVFVSGVLDFEERVGIFSAARAASRARVSSRDFSVTFGDWVVSVVLSLASCDAIIFASLSCFARFSSSCFFHSKAFNLPSLISLSLSD